MLTSVVILNIYRILAYLVVSGEFEYGFYAEQSG